MKETTSETILLSVIGMKEGTQPPQPSPCTLNNLSRKTKTPPSQYPSASIMALCGLEPQLSHRKKGGKCDFDERQTSGARLSSSSCSSIQSK